MPEVKELVVPPPDPTLADDEYDEGGDAEDARRVEGGGVGHVVDAWCGAGGCSGCVWW